MQSVPVLSGWNKADGLITDVEVRPVKGNKLNDSKRINIVGDCRPCEGSLLLNEPGSHQKLSERKGICFI